MFRSFRYHDDGGVSISHALNLQMKKEKVKFKNELRQAETRIGSPTFGRSVGVFSTSSESRCICGCQSRRAFHYRRPPCVSFNVEPKRRKEGKTTTTSHFDLTEEPNWTTVKQRYTLGDVVQPKVKRAKGILLRLLLLLLLESERPAHSYSFVVISVTR